MPRRIIIIGGSLSGAAAAARIRSLDHLADIILFERGATITYAGTAWPGLLLDDTATPRSQQTMTAEDFQRQYRVDVRVNAEVTAIHKLRRLVDVRSASDREGAHYKEKYDLLILATGSRPVIPPVFPQNMDGIMPLKSPADALQIRHALQQPDIRQIAVIGAGCKGIQVADALVRRGFTVFLVERNNHVLSELDPDLARVMENQLRRAGIHLLLHQQIVEVSRQDRQIRMRLDNQEILTADLVILTCGNRPDSELGRQSGLKIGIADSMLVNNNGQTSDKRIFAVGALTGSFSLLTGQSDWHHSAASVVRQARLTADFICGRKVVPQGNIGLMVLALPGLEAASAGAGENQLSAMKVPFFRRMLVDPDQNGHSFQVIKTLWSPQTRRLMGAQIVSSHEAGEKLTALILAMQSRMTADDLSRLELPYESGQPGRRNWLSLIGQTAVNRLDGLVSDFTVYDLPALDTSRITLLDVREKQEFLLGTIPGAINLPLADLISGLHDGKTDLPAQSKPVYLFSGTGRQGYLAARQLLLHGYKEVMNLAGGIWLYRQIFGSAETAATEKSRQTPAYETP